MNVAPVPTPEPPLPTSPRSTPTAAPTPQPILASSPQPIGTPVLTPRPTLPPTPPPTPTSVIVENLAPAIALVPADEVDEDEGRFRIEFSCRGSGDANPTITSATLNGISVTDGQIVELKLEDDGKQKVKRKKGVLTIEAPSFLPTVTCADTSGNQGTATATPVFAPEEEDDDKGGEGEDDDEGGQDDEDD